MLIECPNQYPIGEGGLGFVAEAPAETEVAKGRPLAGRSGLIFNKALSKIGIERASCFVGNVFPWRLNAQNKFDFCQSEPVAMPTHSVMPSPIEAGVYLPKDYAWALDLLYEQLVDSGTTVVVTMGNVATWALTGKTGVTKLRGAFTDGVLDGVKVMPTFHPAMVARRFSANNLFIADIAKAYYEFHDPAPIVRRAFHIPETPEDIDKWFADAMPIEMMSVDIETTPKKKEEPKGWPPIATRAGKYITVVGFAASPTNALVVPFWTPSGPYWSDFDTHFLVWQKLKEILENPIPKVMQNGTFDVWWLWEMAGIGVRNYRHDTRLAHYVLFPELPKSLGSMVATFLNERSWKEDRPKTGKKDDG